MTIPDRKPLLLPCPVPDGGVIGIAAPAGPFPPDRFKTGLERLWSMGFHTVCPSGIFNRRGYLAGTDQERAESINSLLVRKDLDAVMAARGGYGAMRILDHLRLEPVFQNPRPVIGFSDITALHLDIFRKTGLVTIHGPVVTSLAMADETTAEHFYNLITGRPVFPLHLENASALRPGKATGPLLGGNLTLLVHMVACGRAPDLTGAILLVEDVDEVPYRIDRKLTALKLSGILNRCAGVLVGDFTDCGDRSVIENILADAFRDFEGPVVSDIPVGHTKRNQGLPLGPQATLDADTLTLDMSEPYMSIT